MVLFGLADISPSSITQAPKLEKVGVCERSDYSSCIKIQVDPGGCTTIITPIWTIDGIVHRERATEGITKITPIEFSCGVVSDTDILLEIEAINSQGKTIFGPVIINQ